MLDKSTFLIREHVGFAKLHEAYDILDPATGQKIGEAKEETSTWVKLLKFVVNKTMLPFKVVIRDAGGAALVEVRRGFTFLRSVVNVYDAEGGRLGYFRQKVFSLGGQFDFYDDADAHVATLKGDWKGWNFKFTSSGGEEMGVVTKKWAGIGKELFTTADNYVVDISPTFAETKAGLVPLLLAGAVAIDMVLKETG
ncbi:MAG: phospholipid scramblase-related protein [Planctomycetota bacterium]